MNHEKIQLTESQGNNDRYINQLKILKSYENNNNINLRTPQAYNNNLEQLIANNNIQRGLINDYQNNKLKRYVNIDDDINLFNPNIEYNKSNGRVVNTTLRFNDHYINIDSSMRRKEPIITFDGKYKQLNNNSLQLTKDSSLLFIKCNHSLKQTDKIILEGITPMSSSYVDSKNLVLTNDSKEITITITDKDVINIFPTNESTELYLDISDYTNYDVYRNAVNYVGNVPLTLINNTHKFNFKRNDDSITISFTIPFKYYQTAEYPISSIVRTFKITYYFYSNISIYDLNATYPTSIYAKQPYHSVAKVNDNGFFVELNIKAQNDLTFGTNIRYRKLLSYDSGYREPNNYVLELTATYKNIVQVEMISSEFPCVENTIYQNSTSQNNKFYWQNEDDGNYVYCVEIDVGKYTIDNLIKEIEEKVYATNRIYYSPSQLYNNHNIIKVACDADKDLMTFKSYCEYPYQPIRCNEDGELNEEGEYMLITLDYDDEELIFINNNEYQLAKLNNNQYVCKYIDTDTFYTRNNFRLLFNYQDTFGKLLGFANVGSDTSVSKYDWTITNKDYYSPFLGYTLSDDDINIGNTIDLTGHNYIIMTCDELPVMDNVLNVNKNQAFAKILLYGVGGYVKGTDYGNYTSGNFIYNSFVKMIKTYNIPIHELNRLTFKFYSPGGQLYDFNGIDHSFTLRITTLENILDNTNINSHTENTI